MAPRMCFLGMGAMGNAMSRNLATKASLDHPVLLWTRTLAKAHAHSAAVPNTAVAASPAEAVRAADIIWSCLGDDDAVVAVYNDVLGDADAADLAGKLFVECSTINPESTEELARRILERGGEFVAMPVFGEPSMAALGVLTCVPAGKKESVEKVKPYLVGVLGRAVIDYSGESPGKASLLKVIGNVFIIEMVEALAEGHVLAEKSGLGTANLEKFLETVFPGPYMIHSKHMSSGRYYKTEPVGNITMVKTIASHVLDLAKTSGTKLPVYELVRKQMDMVEDQKGPNADVGGLYGVIRTMSGLPYEKE